MRRLFGTNGVRFILGKTMSISDILRLGLAIGTFFKGKKCLMGRDVRLTGEAVASAISSGLMSTGCTVYDVGLITTPALQYLVRRLGFDFGVMITASHNPPEFNGVKVMDSDGVEIPREKEVVIEDIYFRNKFEYANWDKVGDYKVLQGVLDYYIEGVLEHAKIDEITERRFTVVVDPANSVPVFTTPEVLKRLNCRVMTINANLDGDFPGREPEPRPDTLRELAEAVKTAGADLGVGHDGDGDRAIFVDEEGTVHWGDRTGALIVKFFMEEHPGEKIVTPVSTSKVVEDVVKKHGGEVVYTRVGSINVSRKMMEIGAKLGLEENGGIFYGPHHPVRDGTMATVLILNIMAKTGEELSKLLSTLPRYHQFKLKVPCPEELKEPVLKRLREEVKGVKVETIDGVKVWYSDGSWVLMRPSGTEPIYRIYGEAPDEDRARELSRKHEELLRRIVEEVKEEVKEVK